MARVVQSDAEDLARRRHGGRKAQSVRQRLRVLQNAFDLRPNLLPIGKDFLPTPAIADGADIDSLLSVARTDMHGAVLGIEIQEFHDHFPFPASYIRQTSSRSCKKYFRKFKTDIVFCLLS